MHPSPRRILLVRLSHLGDVVLALPVFHALRRAYPMAQIAWAVQPEFAGLLHGMAGLTRLFLFERRGGLRAWERLRTELLAWGAELCVDAQGNWKSAAVGLASGAPRRVGLARQDWVESFAAGALTESCASASGRHGMQRSLALAQHFAPGHSPRLDCALEAEELAQGARELGQRFPARGPAWILHLSAPTDVRSWPLVHYERLARNLCDLGQNVLLLSGPSEERQGAELEARFGQARPGQALLHHWRGQRGLRALAAFFAAARQRGDRLVACDSGPAHLAASTGLPVALLAGPQDPLRTGPWPILAAHSASAHLYLRLDQPPACQPCLARKCQHRRGPVCLSELSPQGVLAQLRAWAERDLLRTQVVERALPLPENERR